jgi:hypothetical protein
VASSVQIPFTTTAPGNFTVPHNLGVLPGSVVIEMTAGGAIWFQTNRYDANNLYLVASDAGLTGYLLVYAAASPFIPATTAGNSTITLQDVIDDALTLGDCAPALATGGFSQSPALSIGNDVMQALINGGPDGQDFNWKWNRVNLPIINTNSLQADYFVPNLVNLSWLESAWAVNINQQSIPKQKIPLEVHKDLEVSYTQTSNPGKVCWSPNNILMSGTWGANPLGPTVDQPQGVTNELGANQSGQQNPGPGVIYTYPVGQIQGPINATTCITDPYGNLWVLTTYGTCGNTQPLWAVNPTFPTYRNPNLSATTVTDGTCVWTAVNPNGQGIRLNPIPPQQGVVWSMQLVGQKRAPRFYNVNQLINPVPDDYEWAFKQGFFCECFRRHPDPKVRAKYPQERQLWLEALDKAVKQSDKEMDDFGFYPSTSIMDSGWAINPVNPAQPYGPWTGW